MGVTILTPVSASIPSTDRLGNAINVGTGGIHRIVGGATALNTDNGDTSYWEYYSDGDTGSSNGKEAVEIDFGAHDLSGYGRIELHIRFKKLPRYIYNLEGFGLARVGASIFDNTSRPLNGFWGPDPVGLSPYGQWLMRNFGSSESQPGYGNRAFSVLTDTSSLDDYPQPNPDFDGTTNIWVYLSAYLGNEFVRVTHCFLACMDDPLEPGPPADSDITGDIYATTYGWIGSRAHWDDSGVPLSASGLYQNPVWTYGPTWKDGLSAWFYPWDETAGHLFSADGSTIIRCLPIPGISTDVIAASPYTSLYANRENSRLLIQLEAWVDTDHPDNGIYLIEIERTGELTRSWRLVDQPTYDGSAFWDEFPESILGKTADVYNDKLYVFPLSGGNADCSDYDGVANYVVEIDLADGSLTKIPIDDTDPMWFDLGGPSFMALDGCVDYDGNIWFRMWDGGVSRLVTDFGREFYSQGPCFIKADLAGNLINRFEFYSDDGSYGAYDTSGASIEAHPDGSLLAYNVIIADSLEYDGVWKFSGKDTWVPSALTDRYSDTTLAQINEMTLEPLINHDTGLAAGYGISGSVMVPMDVPVAATPTSEIIDRGFSMVAETRPEARLITRLGAL